MISVAESWFREGKARGIAEGKAMGIAESIAEGKAMGIAEGEAKLLIRLLEQRFGDLPESARNRILVASGDQIERWSDGIFDAGTLDDLFGEGEPT